MTRGPESVPGNAPDIVVFLADDMGFSDLGCYGGEIPTPHLDALAQQGVRMSQFYNTARCSPARASLLTGLHPHQAGIGILTHDDGPLGYPGTLNDRCATIAEVLRPAGYGTYISGKWHLSGPIAEPGPAWPRSRGFDHWYGIQAAATTYWHPATLWDDDTEVTEFDDDYYLTTELGHRAAGFVRDHHAERPDDPLFLYVPFTAPHWPLHAPEDRIAELTDTYRQGWDELRVARLERLQSAGIVSDDWPDAGRDAHVPAWDDTTDQDWQARRMATYAAQVTAVDDAVGDVVDALRRAGRLDQTMIIFLSDNGGCAEEFPPCWADELPGNPRHIPQRTLRGERVRIGNAPDIPPGGAETYTSYGRPWANLSNTPFREFKHWVHEGGIATPFIVHWPSGPGEAGSVVHGPHQLPDVMATVLDATGATYPPSGAEPEVLPCEGVSMLPTWRGEPAHPDRALFFEHEGNAAVRVGDDKLVRRYDEEHRCHGQWELYDLAADRTEQHNLADARQDRVAELAGHWQRWADRCGVKDRTQVLEVTPTKALTNHSHPSARTATGEGSRP